MSYLYPRLPLPVAAALATERAQMAVLDLVMKSSSRHESANFAPTGGNRVTTNHLEFLQSEIRYAASKCGYPNKDVGAKSEVFDRACAETLYESLELYPAEAAHIEMWAFITTVLLPDVVRWRFPGDATSLDRFLGGDRGLRRNTFGRLWWRAYVLRRDSHRDTYHLLHTLNEDELVQITERPSIAAYRPLAQAVASAHIWAVREYPHLARRALMREGIKRVRRRMSLLCYELMSAKDLELDVTHAFHSAAQAIANNPIALDTAKEKP